MTINFFIILNKIGNITIEIFDYELNQVYKKKKKSSYYSGRKQQGS